MPASRPHSWPSQEKRVTSPGSRAASSRTRRAIASTSVRPREDLRVRREAQRGPRRVGVPDLREGGTDAAALQLDAPRLAVAPHLRRERGRERRDHAQPDVVGRPEVHVRRVPVRGRREVARGQHPLDPRSPTLVDVQGDAGAVVADRHGAIRVQRQLDARAAPRQVLVDGVREHLPDQLVRGRAGPHVADEHPRPLADGRDVIELVTCDHGESLLPARGGFDDPRG